MVTLPQYGYPHPKIEMACKDVTKPQFSGCARHMETYRDFGGMASHLLLEANKRAEQAAHQHF
eukprot:COSAG01_NODE_4846_length_4690_cov_307.130530_1_plen_63_part_00